MRISAVVVQCVVFLVSMIVLGSLANAASAPKELMGKSVSLSWSETHEYRPIGEQNWRNATTAFSVQVYVSEVGRLFIRGTIDNIAGSATGGAVAGSGAKRLSGTFAGKTLVIMSGSGRGNIARQLRVDFDSGFQGCTSNVVYAKQANAGITRDYNPIMKRVDEVKSSTVSRASCGVQAGNVFGR